MHFKNLQLPSRSWLGKLLEQVEENGPVASDLRDVASLAEGEDEFLTQEEDPLGRVRVRCR